VILAVIAAEEIEEYGRAFYDLTESVAVFPRNDLKKFLTDVDVV
jgi:hypothetical protein